MAQADLWGRALRSRAGRPPGAGSKFGAPNDQTITHFGFSPAELRALAQRAGARGVDRLVPVGEALAFDATWDGYDLIGDFLRRVTVRTSAQG